MQILIFLSLVFIGSYITGQLFQNIHLPKLLGYLIVGLFVGNVFHFDTLVSTDMIQMFTSFALSIILLKAGLGIEKDIIQKIGFRVLLMGTIPNIIEALIISGISYVLLQFSLYESLMFGFLISAVSPAVVIPSMTKLMDMGYSKKTTTLNLAATSFDDVISLTFFSVFLTLYLGNGNALTTLGLAPIKMTLGLLVGGVLGYIIAKQLFQTFCLRYQIIQFVLVVGIVLALKEFGGYLFVIEMIAIMAFGFMIRQFNPAASQSIIFHTNTTWRYAQVMLFFMIGYLADLSLALDYVLYGIILLTLGLLGRMLGVMISLYRSDFTTKEKHFSMIGNIPKATVQAVLGAIPLTNGVHHGNIMLSIAVFSIIFTAPIGLICIEIFGPKWLQKE